MNLFPSCETIRRYVSPEEYASLIYAQRHQTFLGECLIGYAEDGIKERIRTLDKLETDCGFVYVGEKQWLERYLENDRSPELSRYHYWVKTLLVDGMGLEFSYTEYSKNPHFPGKVWQAEFDGSEYGLGFEALNNPAYGPIEEVELYVFGDEEGLSPAHLIKAFEFMHDLEYILAAMPADRGGRAPLFVEGLEVANEEEPMRWELNVVSEYGSIYNQTIVNRRKWGYTSGSEPVW